MRCPHPAVSSAVLILTLFSSGSHATTDIPGQLRTISDFAFTAEPSPVPSHLASRMGKFTWDFIPPALQRALLWDAGLIRAESSSSSSSSSSSYLQVYVPCGRTMNDVFLEKSVVGRTDTAVRCDLESCNFVTSNCNLDFLRASTMCGLNATLLDTLSTTDGPSWSQDGQVSISSSYDPVVVHEEGVGRNNTASTSVKTTVDMFVIKQTPSLTLKSGVCPGQPSFIVPCRPLDFTLADTKTSWCVPENQLGVKLWTADEYLKLNPGTSSSSSAAGSSGTSSSDSSSSSSSTVAIILGVALGVVVVLCIVLFVMLRKAKSRQDSSKDYDALPSTPAYSVAGVGASASVNGDHSSHGGLPQFNGSGSSGLKRVSERASDATTVVSGLSSSAIREIEVANENYRKKSTILTEFCEDQALMMKRIAFVRLVFHEPIAKGANGEVWRGQYEGQVVAIKRTRQPDTGGDDVDVKALEEFAKEIRLASMLDHPNVVRFIGLSWRMLPDLSMVSEYMPMGDLARFLDSPEGKQMTWGDEKVSIAVDIANALVYLHSLIPLVVHRDLKSRNVLLDEQLIAKISDFGLSRERSPEETMTSGIGTLLWTAPEVLRGERYDEKADMYSFGVLLVELDTCLPPYSLNPELAGVRSKGMHLVPLITGGQIQPAFSPDCPAPIMELAKQCLDQNPNNRPPAMQVVYHLRSKIRPLL